MGNEILLNGLFSESLSKTALLHPPSGLFPLVSQFIALHIEKITSLIKSIIEFINFTIIGYIKAKTCKIIIIEPNNGDSNVINKLNKKNIKSKFLTPSFTGNLFVVVEHVLSVISFIPKCLALLYPHFHLSIKFATV